MSQNIRFAHTALPVGTSTIEEKKISPKFETVKNLIQAHVSNYQYTWDITTGPQLFDVSPSDSSGFEANLRRYIACNVIEYVDDVLKRRAETKGGNDSDDRELQKYHENLRNKLQPYMPKNQSAQVKSCSEHLEDILKEAQSLADYLSTQQGKWKLGPFGRDHLPAQVFAIPVFPALLVNGKPVKEEEKFYMEMKPLPATPLGRKNRGNWTKRISRAMSPILKTSTTTGRQQHPPTSPYMSDYHSTLLLFLVDLIIYLLFCARAVLVEPEGTTNYLETAEKVASTTLPHIPMEYKKVTRVIHELFEDIGAPTEVEEDVGSTKTGMTQRGEEVIQMCEVEGKKNKEVEGA